MVIRSISPRLSDLKRGFLRLGSIAGLVTVLPSVGSTIFLGFVYQIAPWLQQNGRMAVLVFVFSMTALCGLAVMATNILGVVSGFAFGFGMGLLAQILGICGAAVVMFFLAKKHAASNMQTLINEKPKLKAVHRVLLNENSLRTLSILVLLRLSPAFPFAATNFILAASGISFRTYLVGTLLGMLPRSSALVFVGASLSELDLSQPQQSWVIILGIVATILAVLVIGRLARRTLNKMSIEESGETA